MRLEVMIGWELDTIEYALRKFIADADAATAAARIKGKVGFKADGALDEEDLAIGARSLVINSAMYELNAVTEWILLAMANWAASEETRKSGSAMRRPRAQLVQSVERYFELSLQSLPGYAEVETLREEVNALKHRGGALLAGARTNPFPFSMNVQKSPEMALAYASATRRFLLALWSKVQPQMKHIPEVETLEDLTDQDKDSSNNGADPIR